MNLRKLLPLPGILFATCVTPSFAQIYWSNQSLAGVTDDITAVTYANGTFAAVTNQGNLLTSTNGMTWTSQPISPGTALTSICYGTEWVVVGNSGTILSSSDLRNWTTVKSGTANNLNGVFSEPFNYVAVGDGGTILTSPDGSAWTVQSSGVTSSLYSYTFIPGVPYRTPSLVVVCGQSGTILYALEDVSLSLTSVLSSGTSQNLGSDL